MTGGEYKKIRRLRRLPHTGVIPFLVQAETFFFIDFFFIKVDIRYNIRGRKSVLLPVENFNFCLSKIKPKNS